MANTPEESKFTSIYDRIQEMHKKRTRGPKLRRFCNEVKSKQSLPCGRDDYFTLLDWTGRAIRSDKRGTIPAHLEPVLKRLSLDVENWVNTVQRYGSLFWRVAGRVEQILAAAKAAGRRWLKGVRAGQEIFAR